MIALRGRRGRDRLARRRVRLHRARPSGTSWRTARSGTRSSSWTASIVMLATPNREYQSPKRHRETCDAARRWLDNPWVIDGVLVLVDDLDATTHAVERRDVIRPEEPDGLYTRGPRGHRWMFGSDVTRDSCADGRPNEAEADDRPARDDGIESMQRRLRRRRLDGWARGRARSSSTRRPRGRRELVGASSLDVSRGAYLMNLGLVPYGEAFDLQRSLAGAVSQGAIPETVIFLEHPPVVTIGRRTETDQRAPHPGGRRGRDRRDRPRRQVDVPRPRAARLLPDPRPRATTART